jgi:hypothetical protein
MNKLDYFNRDKGDKGDKMDEGQRSFGLDLSLSSRSS